MCEKNWWMETNKLMDFIFREILLRFALFLHYFHCNKDSNNTFETHHADKHGICSNRWFISWFWEKSVFSIRIPWIPVIVWWFPYFVDFFLVSIAFLRGFVAFLHDFCVPSSLLCTGDGRVVLNQFLNGFCCLVYGDRLSKWQIFGWKVVRIWKIDAFWTNIGYFPLELMFLLCGRSMDLSWFVELNSVTKPSQIMKKYCTIRDPSVYLSPSISFFHTCRSLFEGSSLWVLGAGPYCIHQGGF